MAAAIIVNGFMQKAPGISSHLTDEAGSYVLKESANAAKILLREVVRDTVSVHAYQLFNPDVPYSLNEAAAVFKKAKWPGLTSKASVARLFADVHKALLNKARAMPNFTPSHMEEGGHSQEVAEESAYRQERLFGEVEEFKKDKTYIAYNLLLKAKYFDVRSDKLLGEAPPQCIKTDRAVGSAVLSDGEPFSPTIAVRVLNRKLEQLRAENDRLKGQLGAK
jgi:hypothetical protein